MTDTSNTPAPARLSRSALRHTVHEAVGVAPPIRMVHLGLGAFHRAHQVWYTANADDGHQWGYASCTGRSRHAAEALAPQDGLFTVIERSPGGDKADIVGNLVDAVDGDDHARMIDLIAAPTTAIVTLTITEAGYRLTTEGLPDPDDEVLTADVHIVSRLVAGDDGSLGTPGTGPVSALGRLLAGLAARRARKGGPIAIVSCDNVPDNGMFVRRGLLSMARQIDLEFSRWVEDNASFVSTSVDRITPRTTPGDVDRARELTGYLDVAPVVTEPFRDWILSGEFPAGRPRWDTAGARFVEDITPFERRKLWLLNGAHSFLAYSGLCAGHRTVAEAIADPELRAGTQDIWTEAGRHLPAELVDLDGYTAALLDRFGNARIEHRLDQIAMDGVVKLRVRLAPVAMAERAHGRSAQACARGFAAWIRLIRRGPLPDAHADQVDQITADASSDVVRALIGLVEPRLADDASFVGTVRACAAQLYTGESSQSTP